MLIFRYPIEEIAALYAQRDAFPNKTTQQNMARPINLYCLVHKIYVLFPRFFHSKTTNQWVTHIFYSDKIHRKKEEERKQLVRKINPCY